jgi:phage repressor protein C with HTH and peptisase S24 domain
MVLDYQVNPDWLLLGEGPMYRDERGEDEEKAVSQGGGELTPAVVPEIELPAWAERPDADEALERMTYAPFYEAPAGAGQSGNANLVRVRSYFAFDNDWLRREVNVVPTAIFIAEVYGQSMTDRLDDGDLVLCEYREEAMDGIMVVSYEEEVYIKHVIARRNATRLVSENKHYPDIEVKNDDHFRVLGRVVRKVVRV